MPGRPLLYGGILILCLLLTSMPLRATSFVIGNSRLTFITDHLVRLEYALHQEFLNDSTLFAVVRGEYPVDVKHEQEGRKHVFSTRAMRLEFDNDGFPIGQNNLKGALTTVDGIGGPTTRQEGLLSRDGWYLIQDTGKDIYRHGSLQPRPRSHVQDLYLFVYGTDYKAALKSLAAISGPAPMTRKYVHGAWYCRRWPYTADDYRELAQGYHGTRIPAGHYGI